MIPAPFDYVRAGTADEAIAALAEHGDDAKLLAGGMSLLPLMKLRLATPTVLVDVGRVSELSYIRDAGDHVAVGALTRHRDLETSEVLTSAAPSEPVRTADVVDEAPEPETPGEVVDQATDVAEEGALAVGAADGATDPETEGPAGSAETADTDGTAGSAGTDAVAPEEAESTAETTEAQERA